MPDRLRTPCAVLAAALAALLAGGCFDTSGLKSDVLAGRESRYAGWRSEERRDEVQRPTLSGQLSLEDGIMTALRNSRQIEIAVLERVKAGARVEEAWSQALPDLDLGASYQRLGEVPKVTFGGNTIQVGFLDNYALTARLSQPLYRGGAITAGVRGARIYSVLVDEEMRGTRQAVIFAARKAYYDARLALELRRASADAVSVAQRHLEDVDKNVKAGKLADFDHLRAEVELKTLIAQNVQDENRYHVALTTLLNVLGVSQESQVELSEPLHYRPLTPVLDETVHTAFTQNSDILQAELTIRLQREAVSVARAGYYPQMDAFVQGEEQKPNPINETDNSWGNAWSAGVALTYRVFDGFKTRSQVRQAEAQLAEYEVTLRDTEERTLLQIKQAILSIEDASKEVVAQQANVEEAQEAQRLAELGFSQGVRLQVEVLDAQRALTSAQATYATAVYNHELARLQLEQAIGTLEAPPEGGEQAPLAPPAPPLPAAPEAK
jgi:outer membrane protein TolC